LSATRKEVILKQEHEDVFSDAVVDVVGVTNVVINGNQIYVTIDACMNYENFIKDLNKLITDWTRPELLKERKERKEREK
jgi:hypothetical protein